MIQREIFNFLDEEYLILLVETSLINKHISSMGIYQFLPKKQIMSHAPLAANSHNKAQTTEESNSGKFSCPVDCFLELINHAIFEDFIRHTKRNNFFEA